MLLSSTTIRLATSSHSGQNHVKPHGIQSGRQYLLETGFPQALGSLDGRVKATIVLTIEKVNAYLSSQPSVLPRPFQPNRSIVNKRGSGQPVSF